MAAPDKREWPVRITTLGPIQGGTVAFVEAGVTYVTVVVKATFALIHEAFAVQTAPEPLVLVDELLPGSTSLERASDLAPFVPAVDVIVRGRAHGDGGASVPAVSTRLVMTSSEVSGAEVLIDKTVHVYGPRARVGAYPDSFASFPVVYDFAERPSTDAAFGVRSGDVPRLVLPNGERGYAGFGPIAPTWPDRQGFLEGAAVEVLDVDGARVLSLESESETGAFPFEFFQISPPDQRLTGLEGGEWIVIDGMHRELARFATKLPHMRAEAQLYDPDGRPLPMHLVCDTLSIDMEARTMNALFRGNIPAPQGPLYALSVVATLEVLANEDLDRSVSSFGSGSSFADLAASPDETPLSAEGAIDGVVERGRETGALDDTPHPETADVEPLEDPDSDAGGATAIVVSPLLADPPTVFGGTSERKTVPPSAATGMIADTPFRTPPSASVSLDRDQGARPATSPPQAAGAPTGLPFAPPPPKAPTFTDEPTPEQPTEEPTTGLPFGPRGAAIEPPRPVAPARGAGSLEETADRDPSVDDEPPTRMRSSLPDALEIRATATLDDPQSDAALSAAAPALIAPAAPVTSSRDAGQGSLDAPTTVDETDPRAAIVRKLAKGEALYDANYAGADLSGLDFHGAALTGINLTNAKLEGCRFDGARLGSAKLAGADLRGATFLDAELGQADLSKCKLAGARLAGARLDDANLTLVEAQGASFEGASGQRVAFAQGQLQEARFDGATLAFADCSGADLTGASFRDARLASARFADARGKGVRFDGAELEQASFVGAQLEEASFDAANLRASTLERAKLDGCTFRKSKLTKSILARSVLDRCVFAEADLDGTNFIHATGQAGDLTGASLVAADLRQTKLADMTFERADLRRVNAHKASLVGARFDGANLGGASLRGAKLRGCSLVEADLADADLRDADLENAKLLRLVNRDRAKLGGANLKGAEDDVAPSDLDGS